MEELGDPTACKQVFAGLPANPVRSVRCLSVFGVQCSNHLLASIGYPVTLYQRPGAKYLVLGTWYLVPATWNLAKAHKWNMKEHKWNTNGT